MERLAPTDHRDKMATLACAQQDSTVDYVNTVSVAHLGIAANLLERSHFIVFRSISKRNYAFNNYKIIDPNYQNPKTPKPQNPL